VIPLTHSQPRQQRLGFTLIEVLIVVAIVATLATVTFFNVRRDRPQVRTAASIIAADLNRARTESVRLNTLVAFKMNPTGNSYQVFEDSNRDSTSDTGQNIFERTLSGDFHLADLTSTNFTNNILWFDSRGLLSGQSGTIFFASTQDAGYKLNVVVSNAGRIRVDVP
jgi:prepilin-type N-terminal cleavage/methylation domain-containing protein